MGMNDFEDLEFEDLEVKRRSPPAGVQTEPL